MVGLQEMVNLELIGSIMCNKDLDRMHAWEFIFKNALNKRMPGRGFTCRARKVMFGCFLMVFVRESLLHKVRRIHTCKVKSGAAGLAANKGSTAIRLTIDDTGFLFYNCHLSSGQK